MMTKRDFEALAVALGQAVDLEDAVQRVTAVCQVANGSFDPEKFRARIDEVVIEECDKEMSQ